MAREKLAITALVALDANGNYCIVKDADEVVEDRDAALEQNAAECRRLDAERCAIEQRHTKGVLHLGN